MENEKCESFIFVIFGASGDLTSRKLIPSLFALYLSGKMPIDFSICGTTRSQLSITEFKKKMKNCLIDNFTEEGIIDKINTFIERLFCVTMDPNDSNDYDGLKKQLNESACAKCSMNIIYYYAIMPTLIESITANLCENKLLDETDGFKRIILEKPFGSNLETAIDLNKNLLKYVTESQIYRIDHYMGKETVQNILVTRFANPIFEPLWNRLYIESIEIDLTEELLIMQRGSYYDKSGALRDMLQNHLLQILALIAMDAPSKYDAVSLRNEQLKVFESLRPIKKGDVDNYVVRGQYEGYKTTENIPDDSHTETFVCLKCFVDSYRFKDVPFYLKTGKGLGHNVAEVVITFKNTGLNIFGTTTVIGHNQLIIRIQPDAGMLFKLDIKVPGQGFKTEEISLGFHYDQLVGSKTIAHPYERLLHDCMIGDASLFQRKDCVEETWRYVQPILDHFAEQKDKNLYSYAVGSDGPTEVKKLLSDSTQALREPCSNLEDDGIMCPV